MMSKNTLMPFSYGGGIKTLYDIEKCLNLGCDKVSLNNVVTKNKNTLINYFSDSIQNERPVSLYEKSTRYIFDVDDLVKYVFLTKNTLNSVINLNFNIQYKVTEIWQEVEKALNIKGISTLLDLGNDYKIDNSLFIKEIGENEVPELNDRNYLQKTIQKYLINR